MDLTSAVYILDRELDYVCLRWAAADEVDITLDISQSLRVNQVEEGLFYGLVPFSFNVSTVNVFNTHIGK